LCIKLVNYWDKLCICWSEYKIIKDEWYRYWNNEIPVWTPILFEAITFLLPCTLTYSASSFIATVLIAVLVVIPGTNEKCSGLATSEYNSRERQWRSYRLDDAGFSFWQLIETLLFYGMPYQLWVHPSCLCNGYRVFCPFEWSGCAVKPTTHLHLVLSSGISGDIPLQPPCLHAMHRNNFTFRERWKSWNHQLSPTHRTAVYSHVPHNGISVNDGPHIRRCSHKITIVSYIYIIILLWAR